MSWAASHLTNRKELHQAVEKERFLKAERGWKKEIISKECTVLGKITFPRGNGRNVWTG